MALSATTIWEVETAGSDSLNGGAFDPGQTAGMFTDGAATVANTDAPVFTSASYNFVAGDVGAWVYIASGTNWTPGWYKIASVATAAATLAGTIGQGVLKTVLTPTGVVGCATVASPTGATWSIDYSQQAAAQFAYTDLASAGTGLTVSSAAKPFAKQHVGNSLVITGGTNFNAGRYVIASVAVAVATVVGPTNITTGAGASGTGGQGGALASPGFVGSAPRVASNVVCIKTGTYSITSASTNISGGCIADAITGNTRWEGYGSVRGDLASPPLLQASGIATAVLASFASGQPTVQNISVDGAGLTSTQGFNCGRRGTYRLLTASNCTNVGINAAAAAISMYRCRATGCSGGAAAIVCGNTAGPLVGCEAYTNTIPGFSVGTAITLTRCIASGNTGASSDGFAYGAQAILIGCTAYGNGRDGFRCTNQESGFLMDCLAESNTGAGFNSSAAYPTQIIDHCGGYSNTGSNLGANVTGPVLSFVIGSASFFTNGASGDFSLNATAGGGAAARAASGLGLFPRGLSTGYLDLGAVQHADPAVTPAPTVAYVFA